MKNITKVGLSALAGALAVTSANAGDMSLSGSMEASYTTGSGYSDVGNPLSMDKELSVTASGELDDVLLFHTNKQSLTQWRTMILNLNSEHLWET